MQEPMAVWLQWVRKKPIWSRPMRKHGEDKGAECCLSTNSSRPLWKLSIKISKVLSHTNMNNLTMSPVFYFLPNFRHSSHNLGVHPSLLPQALILSDSRKPAISIFKTTNLVSISRKSCYATKRHTSGMPGTEPATESIGLRAKWKCSECFLFKNYQEFQATTQVHAHEAGSGCRTQAVTPFAKVFEVIYC